MAANICEVCGGPAAGTHHWALEQVRRGVSLEVRVGTEGDWVDVRSLRADDTVTCAGGRGYARAFTFQYRLKGKVYA